jgi:hypothetical protein
MAISQISFNRAMIQLIMAIFFSLAMAQTTIDIGFTCTNPINGQPIVTQSACASQYTYISSCNSLTVKSDYQSCYCNQQLFNELVDCESEVRICLQSPQDDFVYVSVVSVYHELCDTFESTPVTTPVLSSLATTRCLENCGAAVTACGSVVAIQSSCINAFPQLSSDSMQASGYASCICQDLLYALAYTCDYYCPGTETFLFYTVLTSDCLNAATFLNTVSFILSMCFTDHQVCNRDPDLSIPNGRCYDYTFLGHAAFIRYKCNVSDCNLDNHKRINASRHYYYFDSIAADFNLLGSFHHGDSLNRSTI